LSFSSAAPPFSPLFMKPLELREISMPEASDGTLHRGESLLFLTQPPTPPHPPPPNQHHPPPPPNPPPFTFPTPPLYIFPIGHLGSCVSRFYIPGPSLPAKACDACSFSRAGLKRLESCGPSVLSVFYSPTLSLIFSSYVFSLGAESQFPPTYLPWIVSWLLKIESL